MALVLRTTLITTVGRARGPASLRPKNDAGRRVVADAARYRSIGNDAGRRVVADAARYRSIGSLQALGLAVAGAAVTPALLWLAL
ncbi:hypothetical protein ACLBXO_26070 [Methylobacterium sp. C33D]